MKYLIIFTGILPLILGFIAYFKTKNGTITTYPKWYYFNYVWIFYGYLVLVFFIIAIIHFIKWF